MVRAARRFSATIVAIFLFFQSISAEEPVLSTRVACEGRGFSGTLSTSRLLIRFESCTTVRGARSRIWSETGDPMTETEIDAVSGSARFLVGGIEVLPGGNSVEDRRRMSSVLDSSEADLVRRWLWAGLGRNGPRDGSAALAGLRSNLVAYERAGARPGGSSGCPGCCGPSCWGCTGCYTTECRLHDLCVRTLGHAHPDCLGLLPLAALSAWRCR